MARRWIWGWLSLLLAGCAAASGDPARAPNPDPENGADVPLPAASGPERAITVELDDFGPRPS